MMDIFVDDVMKYISWMGNDVPLFEISLEFVPWVPIDN